MFSILIVIYKSSTVNTRHMHNVIYWETQLSRTLKGTLNRVEHFFLHINMITVSLGEGWRGGGI